MAAANHAERACLTEAFRVRGFPVADSRANFVFFDAGSQADIIRLHFAEAGLPVGRTFPQLERWVRITIGPSQINDRVMRFLQD